MILVLLLIIGLGLAAWYLPGGVRSAGLSAMAGLSADEPEAAAPGAEPGVETAALAPQTIEPSDPATGDAKAAPATPAPEAGLAEPEVAEPEAVAALPEASTAGDAEGVPAPSPEAAETEPPAATPAPEMPSAPNPAAPAFDVVRVEPDGSALIAGRAEPGSEVAVTVDGVVVGSAEADAAGGFVALLDLGVSVDPRAVALTARRDGEVVDSEEVVVVAPSPERALKPLAESTAPVVAAVDPANTPGTAGALAEPTAQADAPVPADAAPDPLPGTLAEVEADGEETSEAPSVILADAEGVRVLQGSDTPPEVAQNVVIDAITYDTAGDVALSGRAPGEGFVRVYIDNAPIESGTVGDDGQWQVELPDVDTGTYTLRVDQVDAAGAVVSRAETPFQREAPEAIQALAGERAEEETRQLVELITVQPGNTLWGISQQAFGDGLLFVRVFEANRDKIRDPDLIYPGQIFTVPN